MSIAAKLHIILILTIVAVAVYMFLLYKELRIFERDIHVLKTQVSSLALAAENNTKPHEVPAIASITTEDGEVPELIEATPKPPEEDAGVDVESVTSEEIQNIISHIQGDDEEEKDADEEDEPAEVYTEVPDVAPINVTDPPVTDDVIDDDDVKQSIIRGQLEEKDLTTFDDATLNALKVDEIKSFLKSRLGISTIKGTKAELIAKVKELAL